VAEAMENGWNAAEEKHVRSCSFCQRSIGIFMRIECPSVRMLANYALASENQANTGAFGVHVQEDQCARCLAIVASIKAAATRCTRILELLNPILDAIDMGKRKSEALVNSLIRGLGAADSRPVLVGRQFATTASRQKPLVKADASAMAVLLEVRSGRVFLSVDCVKEPPCKVVEVHILRGEIQSVREVILERLGNRWYGCDNMGQARSWLQRAGQISLLALFKED